MLDRIFTRLKFKAISELIAFVITIIIIMVLAGCLANYNPNNSKQKDEHTISTKKEKGLIGKWVTNDKTGNLYDEYITLEFNSDGSCTYISETKRKDGTMIPNKSLNGMCYLNKKRDDLVIKYKDNDGIEKKELLGRFGYNDDLMTLRDMSLKKTS